ncbi:MAG TPA: hypothetical protein VF807_00040 [Ktedonobacterales bacterium]
MRARLISALLCALLTLAGCGTLSAISGGAPSPTATAVTPNGCAVQQPPSGLPPADVVVKGRSVNGTPTQNGLMTTPIALRRGQTLEMRESSNFRWQLRQTGATGSLSAIGPASWHDSATSECVWRFTGAVSGVTQISFTGVVMCPPNAMCPALAVAMEYEVTVS